VVGGRQNPGVPLKNYIDQSQEFALCMVALTPFVITLYKRQRYAAAVACVALMLGFFANMAFVVSARTALNFLPVLLVLFAFMHLSRRASALVFTGLMTGEARRRVFARQAFWHRPPPKTNPEGWQVARIRGLNGHLIKKLDFFLPDFMPSHGVLAAQKSPGRCRGF
jgi:hypothetical protein